MTENKPRMLRIADQQSREQIDFGDPGYLEIIKVINLSDNGSKTSGWPVSGSMNVNIKGKPKLAALGQRNRNV